jgi:hypothetical protein
MRLTLVSRSGLLLVNLCLALGCYDSNRSAAEPAPTEDPNSVDDPMWFRDDTAAVGIDFVHESGPVGNYFFPQIVGSEAAMLDYDNDWSTPSKATSQLGGN